jgi:hypothetical protein
MFGKSVPHLLKLARSESGPENAHYLVGIGVLGSESAQETEFFQTSDRRIDGSEVADLIVAFGKELSDQLTQLLACANESRRIAGGRIEPGQLLAEAYKEQSRGVSERLSASDARHSLGAVSFHLSNERIPLRVVDHDLLPDLAKPLCYHLPLCTQHVPELRILAIDRPEQQAGEHERTLWK